MSILLMVPQDQTIVAPQKGKERKREVVAREQRIDSEQLKHTLTQQYSLHYPSHKEKEEVQTKNILWKRNQNNSPINKSSTHTGKKN